MPEAREVNIFSDDVVIIIGAGASVPFGLPTGLGLIEQICIRLSSEVESITSLIIKNKSNLKLNFPNSLALGDCPLACALANNIDKIGHLHLEKSKSEITEFVNWLNAQVSDSIDDLIRHNPDKADDLKKCIAYELLMRSGEISGNLFKRRNFDARNIEQLDENQKIKYKKDEDGKTTKVPVTIRNWIHNLINIARLQFGYKFENLTKWKDFEPQPKIKIINFNYDSILEDVISNCWAQVSTELPSWEQIFEIVHPNGKIQISKTFEKDDIPKWISDNSKNIAVIHDIEHEGIAPDREKASQFISNSKSIYAIGFAFAKANCDNLGILDKWADNYKSINYLNFDGNKSLDIRVRRLNGDNLTGFVDRVYYSHEVNKSHIYPMSPTKGDNLEITDALMGGFLGEMPS